MAFPLSPGVNVTEIDLTTVVPSVATTDGALAGVFRWGPIAERILVDSENLLVQRFGKPTNFNAETFFTAANFLAYTNRLYISRGANTTGSTPTAAFTSSANSTVSNNVFVGNTSGLSTGMYITQTSNATVMPSGNNITITSVNFPNNTILTSNCHGISHASVIKYVKSTSSIWIVITTSTLALISVVGPTL